MPDSDEPSVEAVAKRKSLFAFVDLKDPFAPGEIECEEVPGPILSILSARKFELLFLVYTPRTREKAFQTMAAVGRRHPACRVRLLPLPVSDPKDYSSLMGSLWRECGDLLRQSDTDENYICVSSGTAEMRAVWFILTTLGMVKAKLLRVGTPAQPLGRVSVKELRIDTDLKDQTDWFITVGAQALAVDESRSAASEQPSSAVEPPLVDTASEERTAAQLDARHRLESLAQEYGRARRKARTALLFRPLRDLRDRGGAQREFQQFFGRGRRDAIRNSRETDLDTFHESEILPVPGLDDALEELGIYVGSAVLRHEAERAAIAATDSYYPVLVLGQTGTGKERFAHLIHRLSPRASKDMVSVNCAAIPAALAESYLFGHVKGAFSDATSDREGVFESAHESTLFLDEIGELTLDVQAKLLRVLQDGVVQRLGSTKPKKVDVRIIAASNRDLSKEVSTGRFREDLYFRLEVVQIRLPALREWRAEIPELALALLHQINLRRHKPRQLSTEALKCLECYDWPGNVRELENVLKRSVLYARSDVIQADDLQIGDHKFAQDPLAWLPQPAPGFSSEEFLGQVRNALFLRALAACNGNQAQAAELLGVSKQAVSKFVASLSESEITHGGYVGDL